MKARSIITGVLLLFVVVSVGFMIQKEMKTGADTAPEAMQTASGEKVVVYYFHGNARCRTCMTIEAFTKEAVETGFAADLANGAMEFQSVNIEEPANEHFIKDYQMTSRTVVVARFKDGKQQAWKNLDRVWDLVSGKEAFIEYIQQGTRDLKAEKVDG